MKMPAFFLSCFFFPILSVCQFTDTIKVTIHEHEMMLFASGSGKATVIVEAGGSFDSAGKFVKIEKS